MKEEQFFKQTREIKRENLLLSGPDFIAPEKSAEQLNSMTFGFSSDTRKYTLRHSNQRASILIECYDSLPDELTSEEKEKFRKERREIDGIERDVLILASKDFQESSESYSNEPKEYFIAEKRDFQADGFKRFLHDDENRDVLADIISKNTNLPKERAREIADSIFNAELNGDEELKAKNIGLLDKESFEKMRKDVVKHFEMPNPAKIPFENLVEILKGKRVLFYTGAGISAGGGVHDMDGLKKTLQIDQSQICDGFLKIASDDPEKAVALWNEFTQVALNSPPTKAHVALSELAKRLNCKIFTENVDHLHEKTGVFALRPTGDWLKENIQKEWLRDIDVIITAGLSCDDRGFLAWYKENNPNGKIIAINLEQPKYLGSEDFLLQGDLQNILPELEKSLINKI